MEYRGIDSAHRFLASVTVRNARQRPAHVGHHNRQLNDGETFPSQGWESDHEGLRGHGAEPLRRLLALVNL